MWIISLVLAVLATATAIDRHGCTGNILISQFVQGLVGGFSDLLAIHPAKGFPMLARQAVWRCTSLIRFWATTPAI
jgi:hypothetical protein